MATVFDHPTRSFARFAASLSHDSIPDATRQVVGDCVLDTIGCAIFGANQQSAKVVTSWVRSQGGTPDACLWTTEFRGPVANVVLATGTMAHSFDLDDYHTAKVHPGAVIVPTVLALGEVLDSSGEDALVAIVAGYEVMIRASLAAGPAATRKAGWHLTGVFGTLGAAAAAARLMRLDAPVTASALGLAGTQSSGLWAFTADGSSSKRLHPGRAAHAGVLAAQLAASGYQGPTQILEADDGGLLAAVSPDVDFSRGLSGLGERFCCTDTCIKPFSACGSLHSAVEAVIALAEDHRVVPADVSEIVFHTSSTVAQQCGFDYVPYSVLQAQMSAQYTLAVSLLDGECLPEQFAEHRITDERTLDVARKVRVVVNDEMENLYPEHFAARVEIVMHNGVSVTKRIVDPIGSPQRRQGRQALERKFMTLGAARFSDDRLTQILRTVACLDKEASVRELTALLRPEDSESVVV